VLLLPHPFLWHAMRVRLLHRAAPRVRYRVRGHH
jgi:hypothetical protein